MSWSFFEGADKDRPRVAFFLTLAALTVLSLQDATVKLVSPLTTLWQFQTVRGLFNLMFLGIFLGITGRMELFIPKRLGPVLARTVIQVATMIFFFAGAPFLTLAEMGAGLYTYPVFMTVLGWLILDEEVGRWRVLAIVLAAIGAVLIIRPGTADFSPVQLLPVMAGLCYAINSIILRKYCRDESSLTLTAWVAGGFVLSCVIGGGLVILAPIGEEARGAWPFLLTVWPALGLVVVLYGLFASLCNVLGNVMIVKAYQSAQLSWLAPFDYSYLILATFWGFVLFSELPDGLAVLGMALIAVGGILTAYRTRVLKAG